jgi:murein DD-endopeptidase MepM/ murein hydrolase activator NlpD
MNHKKVIRIIAVLMASLLLLSLLASVIPVRAHADDFESQLAALNSEKDSAKQRRVAAQNKVQALKEEQAAVIDEKMALEERKEACLEEIRLIEEQIALINAEILLYDEKIAQKEEDVRAAKEREDLQMGKYRTRVRAMEENGGYNVLAVLFSADSFDGLLTAIDDYGEIMNSDVILYDQLQEARAAHQALEQEYREYQAECEVKKAEHEATKVGLEADKADLEGQIAEADALIEEYVAKIEAAEEEQRAAEAAEASARAAADAFLADYYARQAAAAAAAAAAAQQTTTVYNEETGTYEEQTVSQPVQQPAGGGGSGSYVWPFPGHTVITSPYGQRASTGSFHSGIDIDGFQSAGAAIVAADGGTVIMAEYSGGYGNTIMIDHGGGIVTLYAHLNSMSVGVGSSVSQGQTIGGVGNTGTVYGADGVHLHFEVRVNGSTTDPLNYIGGYPHSFY